jgi:hypothetical protein
MSEWDFIFKNKPVVINTARLHITMSLGYMLAGTEWHTQEQYNQLLSVVPIPWDRIQITVKLDQQTIFKSTINDLVEVMHVFEDSVDTQSHVLVIHIDGIDDCHRPLWPTGQNGGAMLKVHSVLIEDLDMCRVIPKLGNYILQDGSVNIATNLAGSNGTQTLPFTTPIYSWLIENHDVVLNR